MEILRRGGIVEAPSDGMGGPRWVATLENGTVIIGRPSWMGNSGAIALPNHESQVMSDWRRLRDRCAETGERLQSLSLYVPPYGRFEAPAGRGGYGYFEDIVVAQKTLKSVRSGVRALAICYPEGKYIKIVKVFADGTLEHRVRRSWLPCMIGEPQKDPAQKDEGDKVEE